MRAKAKSCRAKLSELKKIELINFPLTTGDGAIFYHHNILCQSMKAADEPIIGIFFMTDDIGHVYFVGSGQ